MLRVHTLPGSLLRVLAVDDTMFRRSGRKVYAAHWGYDGSLKVAKGNQKLSRGNSIVVVAVVVTLPFLDRPIALPVLARLWRKADPRKPPSRGRWSRYSPPRPVGPCTWSATAPTSVPNCASYRRTRH